MAAADPSSCCATACTTQVLVCRCLRASTLDHATVGELLDGLGEMDVDLVLVDDLCGVVATPHQRAVLAELAPGCEVVACEGRAVRCLLGSAGLAGRAAAVHNLRSTDPRTIIDAIAARSCVREPGEPLTIDATDGWLPWFPVIDHERCTDCQQCASFCLFDVFAVSPEGRVEVAQPASCKPNCPACARLCPEAAIIFPKSPEPQINGGDPLPGTGSTPWQVDLRSVFGEDPMGALAERRRRARGQLLKREAIARAEAERERCACSSNRPVIPQVQLPSLHSARPCCEVRPATPGDDE